MKEPTLVIIQWTVRAAMSCILRIVLANLYQANYSRAANLPVVNHPMSTALELLDQTPHRRRRRRRAGTVQQRLSRSRPMSADPVERRRRGLRLCSSSVSLPAMSNVLSHARVRYMIPMNNVTF